MFKICKINKKSGILPPNLFLIPGLLKLSKIRFLNSYLSKFFFKKPDLHRSILNFLASKITHLCTVYLGKLVCYWIQRLAKLQTLVIIWDCVQRGSNGGRKAGESCARNYRPSFRENKPKTIVFYA
jgi:hypothetical protein